MCSWNMRLIVFNIFKLKKLNKRLPLKCLDAVNKYMESKLAQIYPRISGMNIVHQGEFIQRISLQLHNHKPFLYLIRVRWTSKTPRQCDAKLDHFKLGFKGKFTCTIANTWIPYLGFLSNIFLSFSLMRNLICHDMFPEIVIHFNASCNT